jgi:hypothetical protein
MHDIGGVVWLQRHHIPLQGLADLVVEACMIHDAIWFDCNRLLKVHLMLHQPQLLDGFGLVHDPHWLLRSSNEHSLNVAQIQARSLCRLLGCVACAN